MRLGKKLKAGLKLGAKIAGGALAVGAGLFALGSKASPSATESPTADFTGSIRDVSTERLDQLYPNASQGMGGMPLPAQSRAPPVISTAQPRQESTQSIIRRRVNDVPAGFIPPPTGNQNFVGGAIDPRFN